MQRKSLEYRVSFVTLQFDIEECHFLVDLDTGVSNDLEPCYSCDDKNWHVVAKYPFLNAARYVPMCTCGGKVPLPQCC